MNPGEIPLRYHSLGQALVSPCRIDRRSHRAQTAGGPSADEQQRTAGLASDKGRGYAALTAASAANSNAMAAWRVEEDRIDRIGELMASFKEVSHCYRRNPTGGWPYNLYTMIHASDKESCKAVAREMSRKASVENYTLLFSRRELKKTSMKYFPDIR